MSILKKCTLIASSLLLSTQLFAAPKSADCPLLEDVKAEGLSYAERIFGNFFVSYNMSNYQTDQHWVFVFGPVSANSIDEALEQSNALAANMEEEAVQMEEEGITFCRYKTQEPLIQAIAVEANLMISPAKLNALLNK